MGRPLFRHNCGLWRAQIARPKAGNWYTDRSKAVARQGNMNIAINIDDTLTDSFDYFQPFVAEYFGVDLGLV